MFNIGVEIAIGDWLPLLYTAIELVKDWNLEGERGWVRGGSIGKGSKVSLVVGH